MQVVKASKIFRQISIFMSLLLAAGSIIILCVPYSDCSTANLKITIGLIFVLWSCVFILLLLQVVGLTGCLKKYPKALFGFYAFVCVVMFFVQEILWGGSNNNCMSEVPLLYWWLTAQITIFYIIVAFGLCTWGSYLCKVADAAEELTKEAVDEYLKDRKKVEKHYMIKAGDSSAKLLQNGAGAPPPSTQRLMIQQQNQYAPIPHSDAAMIKANQPLLHAKTVQMEKEMRQQQLEHNE